MIVVACETPKTKARHGVCMLDISRDDHYCAPVAAWWRSMELWPSAGPGLPILASRFFSDHSIGALYLFFPCARPLERERRARSVSALSSPWYNILSVFLSGESDRAQIVEPAPDPRDLFVLRSLIFLLHQLVVPRDE